MAIVIKFVLLATYPLLLLARIGDLVRGRDPLRLKNPRGSMWTARHEAPPAHSYFSTSHPFLPSPSRARLLAGAARVLAPKGAAAPRRPPMPDQIPDEVYTLW
jgi:hypothetical protein